MEEERERRRMKDKQRRLSMTLEQRERHLARRRHNYQLRRLRSETESSSLPQELGFESGSEMVVCDEQPKLEDDDDDDNLKSIILESAFQETSGQTLRLSRIRCLARSLSYVSVEHSKSNTDSTRRFGEGDSRRLLGGVRLNHVKCLARGWITFESEANHNIHREQDMVVKESLVVNGHAFGQPIISGNDDRTTMIGQL